MWLPACAERLLQQQQLQKLPAIRPYIRLTKSLLHIVRLKSLSMFIKSVLQKKKKERDNYM